MGQTASRSSRKSKTTRSAAAVTPATPPTEGLSTQLALGAGCYWGTEKYVVKDFQKQFPGAIKTAHVGFMSPREASDLKIQKPTYRQVCSGQSGHIEVLYVELNDPQKHFEELIRFFFQFHDPTTKNRQGNDAGFQYASWIFCGDAEQAAIAQRVRDEVQSLIDDGSLKCFARKEVTTAVTPLKEFTKAGEDHQRYLEKHPNGYCNHRMRFKQYPQLKQQQQPQVEAAKE